MNNILYYIVIGLFKALALLPLSVLYLISDFAFVVVFHLVKYRRKVVRENLDMVFGAKKSKEEIDKIEREFFGYLSDSIFETIKLLNISDEQMRRRMRVTNPELVDTLAQDGRSQVVMLGHYCNWEWIPALSLVLNNDLIIGQLYQPLSNKLMDRVMLKIRSRFGLESMPRDFAIRRLLGIEREGRHFFVGFISDQRPAGPVKSYHNWVEFLGQETAYVVGGEAIGKKVNANFIYTDVRRVSRGHYELTFVPITVDPEDKEDNPYTRKFLKMLEDSIERDPAYWLWSHKRWKKKRLPEQVVQHKAK